MSVLKREEHKSVSNFELGLFSTFNSTISTIISIVAISCVSLLIGITFFLIWLIFALILIIFLLFYNKNRQSKNNKIIDDIALTCKIDVDDLGYDTKKKKSNFLVYWEIFIKRKSSGKYKIKKEVSGYVIKPEFIRKYKDKLNKIFIEKFIDDKSRVINIILAIDSLSKEELKILAKRYIISGGFIGFIQKLVRFDK